MAQTPDLAGVAHALTKASGQPLFNDDVNHAHGPFYDPASGKHAFTKANESGATLVLEAWVSDGGFGGPDATYTLYAYDTGLTGSIFHHAAEQHKTNPNELYALTTVYSYEDGIFTCELFDLLKFDLATNTWSVVYSPGLTGTTDAVSHSGRELAAVDGASGYPLFSGGAAGSDNVPTLVYWNGTAWDHTKLNAGGTTDSAYLGTDADGAYIGWDDNVDTYFQRLENGVFGTVSAPLSGVTPYHGHGQHVWQDQQLLVFSGDAGLEIRLHTVPEGDPPDTAGAVNTGAWTESYNMAEVPSGELMFMAEVDSVDTYYAVVYRKTVNKVFDQTLIEVDNDDGESWAYKHGGRGARMCDDGTGVVRPMVLVFRDDGLGFIFTTAVDGASVSLVSPADGAPYWTGSDVLIQAEVTLNGAATSATVEFFRDGTSLGTPTFNSDTGYYEMTIGTSDLGDRVISAEAVPDVGSTGTASATITLIRVGAPGALETQIGYTGEIEDVRDDPAAPDSDWITQDDTGDPDGVLRFSFPSPGGDLDEATDAQGFNFWLRKQGLAGDPDPVVDVELWESGSLVATLATDVAISNLTGELLAYVWTATALIDTTGEGVEIRLVATRGSTTGGGADTYSPDALLEQTGLSGSVSDIQDDPDSPDANWLTSNANGSTMRASFPTPVGDLDTAADAQEFRVLVRKDATGGGDPTIDALEVYENGSLVATLASSVSVTSATGTVLSYTWDASVLNDVSGAGVEIRIASSKDGGGPNERNVEIGAVEWNATIASFTDYPSGVDVGAVEWDAEVVESGIAGIAAVTLPEVAVAATSTVASPPNEATATVTLGALTVSSTATVDPPVFDGVAATILGALQVSAAADVGEAQRGRPARTTRNKAWTNELGETEDLHLSVDEEEPDYSDYAQSAVPPGDNKFGTGFTMVAPVSDSMHAIMLEAARYSGDRPMDLHVTLYEGGTERAFWEIIGLVETPTAYTLELTEAEAAAITDYSNLEVTYQAIEGSGGSAAGAQIYWVAFQASPSADGVASAYVELSALQVGATGTVAAPEFQATAGVTLGALSVAATGTQIKTFEGAADVTLAPLAASATATADPPTYEATATATLGALQVTSSATVEPPGYEGVATIELGALSVAATGSLATATFEGVATVALGPLEVSGTATVEVPEFTATVDIALSALTSAGTATVEVPTYEATATIELGVLAVEATAEHLAGGFTGSAIITLGALQASAAATTEVPTYEATAGATLGGLQVLSSATVEAPTFEASSTIALGALTILATATQGIPDVDGSVDIALPSLQVVAEGAHVPPGYVGTVDITLGVLAVSAGARGGYDPRDYYPRNPRAPHYNPHSAGEGHHAGSQITAGHKKRGETT